LGELMSNWRGNEVGDALRKGIRGLIFPGVWIYIPLFLFLAVLAYRAVATENDYSFYWRDPAAIMNTGPWIGLFSNIGVFVWWISAVICVFSGIILWRVPGQRLMAKFFLAWGILTGVLALDDFFMIHEWVVPTYLPLSDDVMFGVYAIVAVALLVYFRTVILATRFPILLFAGACLGLSIVIDVLGFEWFQNQGVPTRIVWNLEYVVEDGLKLVGLTAWLHYFALTCYETFQRVLARGTAKSERVPSEQPAEKVPFP
jgi:hypothetical protein